MIIFLLSLLSVIFLISLLLVTFLISLLFTFFFCAASLHASYSSVFLSFLFSLGLCYPLTFPRCSGNSVLFLGRKYTNRFTVRFSPPRGNWGVGGRGWMPPFSGILQIYFIHTFLTYHKSVKLRMFEKKFIYLKILNIIYPTPPLSCSRFLKHLG